MTTQEESCSLMGPKETGRGSERAAIWGLYCVYMAIGGVGDFFVTFLTAPTLCQYVFGPMGDDTWDHVTVAQCNVAGTGCQLPWFFKLFFGFFLDAVPFFGSRRKGWILFGWTGGLTMLALIAVSSEHLVETHQFGTYLYMLMGLCFCYTFSDVAGDGLAIELSRYEPDDKKGYILTTCQMLRFTMMTITTACGLLFMSGKSYQPPGGAQPGTFVMPFELNLGQIHWMLFFMTLPLYIGMWFWLRDPPVPEQHVSICSGLRSSWELFWTALKSFAVFMLLTQLVGMHSIASMPNPAYQGVASISKPTNFQSSIGAMLGSLYLTLCIWVFRRFLLTANWRLTLLMMQPLIALTSVLAIMIVYDAWGVSRNGWMFTVQSTIPPLVGGLLQVVSSIAIIEISPPGLESTLYELHFSANMGSIALGFSLQTLFVKPFDLGKVNSVTWDGHPELVPTYERRLALATFFTFGINALGTCVFIWFVPSNAAECRRWADKVSWHRNWAAWLNLLMYLGPVAFSTYSVFRNLAVSG